MNLWKNNSTLNRNKQNNNNNNNNDNNNNNKDRNLWNPKRKQNVHVCMYMFVKCTYVNYEKK